MVNGKKGDDFPNIFVNDEQIKVVQSTKYLGDIINSKRNDDMMKERKDKAISKLITTISYYICNYK